MKRYTGVLMTAAVAAFVSIATMIVVLPFGGLASQNNQFLPTTGTYSGLTAANTINNAIDSLNTCNSGSVAPTNALGGTPKEGQCWLDTTSATAKILKRYTGSAWVVEAVLDVTNSRWQPPIGGGTGTVASAATTDLCASPQAVQTVSGTTTITSFGSNCVVGIRKTLIFSGVLTLTHNATSLIIPSGVNKTTAAGDVAETIYLGSGNWRVLHFVPLSGASVLSIDTRTGNFTTANGIDTNGATQIQLTAARRTLPTRQFFLSGSGTYTTPANVLWIRVRLVGGGGGGGGANNSTPSTAGGGTTFNAGTLTAGGGGTASASANAAGGGSATGGNILNIPGGGGQASIGNNNNAGGQGGSSCFGGAGGGGLGNQAGSAAATNSGGGGGGGGGLGAVPSGGGGGSGGCVEHIFTSPAASYSYAVGAGGAGASGTTGGAGGSGAAGMIIVDEHYGS